MYRRRLPRGSTSARDPSAASTVGADARRLAPTILRVQTARLRWGVATAGQSSFSQLKLSENRRKHSSPTTPHLSCNVVVNAFQQYEWLAGLAMAKFERRCLIIRACTSTVAWNSACSLEICNVRLLKSGASRQEKTSACNRNGAAADEHFRDSVVLERCADVNATGTQHLDSLLDDDRLFARREAVTNKVSDGAT